MIERDEKTGIEAPASEPGAEDEAKDSTRATAGGGNEKDEGADTEGGAAVVIIPD